MKMHYGKKKVNNQSAVLDFAVEKKRSDRKRYKATTSNSFSRLNSDVDEVEEAAFGLILLSKGHYKATTSNSFSRLNSDVDEVEEAAFGLILLSKGHSFKAKSLQQYKVFGFCKKKPSDSCASVSKNHIFECSDFVKRQPETAKPSKKPKKLKKKNGIIDFAKKGLEPPPKISKRLLTRIEEKGGVDIQLVIMKQITNTDLNKHNGRLSMPLSQVRSERDNYFLSEEEERSTQGNKEGKKVMVMEPCGEESSLVLVTWEVGNNSDSYMLRTGWNGVLQRNQNIKLNDVIQVWSFRVATQLWIAIDKIWDAPKLDE